jgi:hypothetical protein
MTALSSSIAQLRYWLYVSCRKTPMVLPILKDKDLISRRAQYLPALNHLSRSRRDTGLVKVLSVTNTNMETIV